MEREDINIMKMLLDNVIFHSHPEYPGWKSEFKMTFTEDERKALSRISVDLDDITRNM